jgi:hypothetical protein
VIRVADTSTGFKLIVCKESICALRVRLHPSKNRIENDLKFKLFFFKNK